MGVAGGAGVQFEYKILTLTIKSAKSDRFLNGEGGYYGCFRR
jgi:hypothetical protein